MSTDPLRFCGLNEAFMHGGAPLRQEIIAIEKALAGSTPIPKELDLSPADFK